MLNQKEACVVYLHHLRNAGHAFPIPSRVAGPIQGESQARAGQTYHEGREGPWGPTCQALLAAVVASSRGHRPFVGPAEAQDPGHRALYLKPHASADAWVSVTITVQTRTPT